jgi:hypothetical protein
MKLTREKLRKLLELQMDATTILQRIKSVNGCGGSGSDYEPALNAKLDAMLAIIQPTPPPNSRSPYEPIGFKLQRGQRP